MHRVALAALLTLAQAWAAGGEFMDCVAPTVSTLMVRAMTRRMAAVDDLEAGDFEVKAGGTPVKVCGFSHSRVPVSIGIVLDTSGSMRGEYFDAMGVTLAGLDRLLELLGPGDEVFLVHAGEGAPLIPEFSTDRSQIRNGLKVEVKGKTALLDVIYPAIWRMGKARNAAQGLVVLSDGKDNISKVSDRELDRAWSASPVPVFVLAPRAPAVSPRLPFSTAEETGLTRVMDLVIRSGGYATSATSQKEMAAAVFELMKMVASPYRLSFDGRPVGNDLQIQVPGRRPRPILYRGVRLLSR